MIKTWFEFITVAFLMLSLAFSFSKSTSMCMVSCHTEIFYDYSVAERDKT